ncbi:MAG: family 43 glycosylhydrolase [Bacteroidota bacterium]
MKIASISFPVIALLAIQLFRPGSTTAPQRQSLPVDSPQIVWDQSTIKKVSSSAGGERYCGYARMIQLQDKSLIVVYEASGNVVCVKSTDRGDTWSEPISIAQKDAGVNMSVPDILQLKDRSLLICYNPRPSRNTVDKRFGIRTKKSTDGGLTWTDERLVYEAGDTFGNGCWEPAAIQLPNGEVQLFFANEGPYSESNEQEISIVRSADQGLSWTAKPQRVSFRAGKRDGMPVPVLLNNGKEIAFAIEDDGSGNFKPYIIKNTLTENWSNPVLADSKNRHPALRQALDKDTYAGAPYLTQMKTGETILSYQGTEGRTNKMEFADMKVVVGDENALNFGGKSTPFVIPAGKSCLWNSLCVLDDNTIVALTSTNAFSNRTEIYMVRGRLKQRKLLLADPTIFADRGKFYLYGTSSNRGFEVYQSDDLLNWSGAVGARKGFALAKGEAYGKGGFWAPQVFKRGKLYYMSYTADEQIAIATADNPLGPFVQNTIKPISGEGKQIDPFVFFDTDGKVYLYHVKLKNGNRIFVSEMKHDLSDVVPGTAIECIHGDLPWENTAKTEWAVTEGPTVIKHKNLYYMIYSANDFRNIDYAVGYATATSPLGPWKKYKGSPIISRANLNHYGTGHGDLFIDQNGQYQYVMHTHLSETRVSPRATGMVGLKFEAVRGGADKLVAQPENFHFLKTPAFEKP